MPAILDLMLLTLFVLFFLVLPVAMLFDGPGDTEHSDEGGEE